MSHAPTVLLIDDETSILETLRILLRGEGYVVHTAHGGRAGLEQIAALRGAVNGLMSEVLEAHIREDFSQPAQSDVQRSERVQELLGLVRSYLK